MPKLEFDEPSFARTGDGSMRIQHTMFMIRPTITTIRGTDSTPEQEAFGIVESLKSLDHMCISVHHMQQILDQCTSVPVVFDVEVNGKRICKIHLVP